MLHACFTPIALCFIYTSWHFYAFYETNLLTRCHSVSSYFLLFFYSRFLPKEICSELDETKPKVTIFCHIHGVQRGDGEEPGGGHTIGWHGCPLAMPPHGVAPWCPLASPFRLYNAFDAKTLKESASIHEKFCSTAAIEDEVRGIEVSLLAPCRDGELPPEPSPSTPPPSSSSLLAPMMRRE
jgi:hypothetical protein